MAGCTTQTIRTRADVDAARYCTSINGDLILDTSFDEISVDDFPYLRRVAGALKGGMTTSKLKRLTLGKLQSLDYGFSLFEFPMLSYLSLPELTKIGNEAGAIGNIAGGNTVSELYLPKVTLITGDVTFQMLIALKTLDLSSLQVVRGKFVLGVLPRLTSLNVPMLMRVNSTFSMVGLLRVPYSRISKLNSTTVSATPQFSDIGCCIPNASLDVYACSGNYSCDL